MIGKIIPLTLAFIACANGLIGYDCGSKMLNITTLSLIDVDECEPPTDDVDISPQYIQLLQINDFISNKVIQCKLEIRRTVFHCGMYSHISMVNGGINEYINEISKAACEDAHRTGTLNIGNNHVIRGLHVNRTVSHGIILAGSLTSDGACDGAGYSDPYGSWESVVVQGTIKITLAEHIARVEAEHNKIHLHSGTSCILSDGSCVDSVGGYTFWSSVPIDNCKFHKYSILYEGKAFKMNDLQGPQVQTVYSLTSEQMTFALTAKQEENVCGYKIIKTEHPKLVIFETTRGESFAATRQTTVDNLDIFAYVNSKFVYVEKHIRSQMKYLYRDVVTQRCNIERQTLKNSLAIATQSPDEFAYNLMKGPGYMAVVAGEVVHIVKCVPVSVKIQHGEYCYAELEVSLENNTYFMTPRTHVLKTKGTQIACNALLPAQYQVGELWYKILPRPVETPTPIKVKPLSKAKWVYTNPAHLATSGIYTEQDLKDLRERIMFPVEGLSYLNDLAREMGGHPITDNEGSIVRLLNEDAVEKILDSTWNKAWSKFLAFGNFSAGVIAIFIILRVFKSLVDVMIRGYHLFSIFGWSFKLIGAIWSSIAHLMMHLEEKKPEKEEPKTTPEPKPSRRNIESKKKTTEEEDELLPPPIPMELLNRTTTAYPLYQVPTKNPNFFTLK